MRRLIGLVFVLLVVGFGLSFALLNAGLVTLDYYLGTTEVPLSLALTLALVVGAILGLAAATAVLIRDKREAARLRRRLGQMEKELSELRKLPLRDTA
ncbi:MAG TPA: LapA family protein [Gammaproteobacteria bacterium]|nr:LapA family protein [Gammaproteobacteria bacterium]